MQHPAGGAGTMRLALYFRPTGHHQAAWRHPDGQADAAANFRHVIEVAREAERAKFDTLFMADSIAVRGGSESSTWRLAIGNDTLDPLSVMTALAAVTERIGLVSTITTTYNEPFHVARKLATIDVISGGRVGWNVVTSGPPEAPNFGASEHMEHDLRYARADEFLEVCKGLWDSYEDDAFVRDPESGVYIDPAKIHRLDHEGEHFSVAGPLDVGRPVQGYPLIAQAGMSKVGVDFAARNADMVFTTAQTIDEARMRYDQVKQRVVEVGRDPDHVCVMPGLVVLPGRTDEEAEEEYQRLQSLIHIDVALGTLETKVFADLTGLSPDEPLPASIRPEDPDVARYFDQWYDVGVRDGLSLRELAYRAAGTGYTGLPLRGSVTTIADLMEEWFTAGVADGFVVMPSYFHGAFRRFVDDVMPELRRRGLARTDYDGTTLREHFGAPRPAWRSHAQRAARG